MSTRGSVWAFPGQVWYPAGRVPLGIVASGPAEALRGDGGWRVSDSPAALTAEVADGFAGSNPKCPARQSGLLSASVKSGPR
jgi:hypothetical protein